MADTRISGLTNYTTPIDVDVVPIVDTTAVATKKVTWANIKATLKSYFDSVYAAGGAYTTTAINYQMLSTDQFVEVTASGKTITLPTAVGAARQTHTITNSSTGDITINTTASETINGVLTGSLASQDAITVVSNGVGWRII